MISLTLIILQVQSILHLLMFPSVIHHQFLFVIGMYVKVSKGAKIRSRYNQVTHPTQDTNGKVTNSQLDTTDESQDRHNSNRFPIITENHSQKLKLNKVLYVCVFV